ncbi:MAG: hypothetical protein IT374_17325 [Polyangiaceae bacterium]|nr:hypothetical protein [Polyangiaceae bacterium]
MSDESIPQLLLALPEDGLTVTTLRALDWVVPGEWQNPRSLEQIIVDVTGETDEGVLQAVGERAIALYHDESQGYQRAVWLYQAVDSVDKLAGAAALANKMGDAFSFLGFLDRITPDADTTQAIDAGIKFAAELGAFCSLNGLPGDSIGDFAGSLAGYAREDVMRLAAWLSLDCLLPLGPDFIAKILEKIDGAADEHLGDNSLFQKVSGFLPGGVAEQRGIIRGSIEQASGFLTSFVDMKGLSQNSVFESVRHYVDVGDNGLDYVAGAVDVGTNVFEHTGIQTVARRLVSRAFGEI